MLFIGKFKCAEYVLYIYIYIMNKNIRNIQFMIINVRQKSLLRFHFLNELNKTSICTNVRHLPITNNHAIIHNHRN